MVTRSRLRAAIRVTGSLIVAALFVGYFLWKHHGQKEMIMRLGPGDRQAVFESTLAGFQKFCADSDDSTFGQYCSTQGEFLALFPECDRLCSELIQRSRPGPRR